MIKFLVLSIGLLAAAQAPAVTISFQYDGKVSTEPSTQTMIATAFFANAPALNAAALTYWYTTSESFADGRGSILLVGGQIDFAFHGSYGPEGVTGGIVRFFNGTGGYANYNGTGSLTHSIVEGDLVAGSFDAEIGAVPEPASLAIFAVGGVGLVRRVRKAGR